MPSTGAAMGAMAMGDMGSMGAMGGLAVAWLQRHEDGGAVLAWYTD